MLNSTSRCDSFWSKSESGHMFLPPPNSFLSLSWRFCCTASVKTSETSRWKKKSVHTGKVQWWEAFRILMWPQEKLSNNLCQLKSSIAYFWKTVTFQSLFERKWAEAWMDPGCRKRYRRGLHWKQLKNSLNMTGKGRDSNRNKVSLCYVWFRCTQHTHLHSEAVSSCLCRSTNDFLKSAQPRKSTYNGVRCVCVCVMCIHW